MPYLQIFYKVAESDHQFVGEGTGHTESDHPGAEPYCLSLQLRQSSGQSQAGLF